MKHDGELDLATGLGAKSRSWKNKKITWSNLVKRLSEPTKTNETIKEFLSASKAEQGKIKDVGGYVGAFLSGGRRKPENVLHKQIITLDLDFAHMYFWDDFVLTFNNAAVLHATHKHTPESPRFRLVMPLSREVSADEYVAISRKVAGDLDIELFDNTTFEVSRLMFWPSIPSNVEYYYEALDGPWLDADAILDSYVDWKDSSSWPVSDAKLTATHELSKKQEDPETKKGIIGAFCRSYSIQEAIDAYLQDRYVPTTDNRYTYLKGSTASGLTVYDDKFAYSHHGTDPCSGKLCNVFDLVRIHLFGHLDESETQTKSFRAMEELAVSDKVVKKTIAVERMEEAKLDFEGIDEEDEELSENEEVSDLDWVTDLEVDVKGKYTATAQNISLIYANDRYLKSKFKLNVFDNKPYLTGSVPWRKVDKLSPIRNVDYSGIRNYIECVYGISSAMKIEDALNLELEKNSFHPVTDYLSALVWDGVERIDNLLIDYFGANDDIYSKEAIRKALVGAVARVYRPGVKFDLVLTFVGAQGTGKSTFFSKLGKSWFSDTFMTVHGKEALEQIQGAWLIEMAELSGLKKADIESVKHFISKKEDMFRPAYGRTTETYKRQCVFFGTTNNKDFLRDPTGNRRFLPVDVVPARATKSPLTEELDGDVDQIWAEAVEMFRNHEKLYLSEAAEAIAEVEQEDHSERDERTGIVSDFLDRKIALNWDDLNIPERTIWLSDEDMKGAKDRDTVCVAEIWCECFGREKKDISRYGTRELNDIMRSMKGWDVSNSTKNFKNYGKQKFYSRIERSLL